MMYFKFPVLPTLALAVLSLASAVASSASPTMSPIPPAGLFCCPPFGPYGHRLNRQQDNPYNIFCYYSEDTSLACFYNPGTGALETQNPGCFPQAPRNPHPPKCPI